MASCKCSLIDPTLVKFAPLTCYAGQISLCHAKTEKIFKKFFVMINKDGGGGQFLDFMGGHRTHGGPPVPPIKENPARNGSFWKKCSCEPCL